MLVCLGYHAGDLTQAERLADWMRELGPYPGHSLLVARDKSAQAQPFANVGFDSVEEIVVVDDAWGKWPESANNVFRKLAKHIQYTKPQPWLLLEPDAVPIASGWLDALAAEHKRGNMPFCGNFVAGVQAGGDASPDHMSGVGVYPGKLTDYAGLATVAMEVPWDLAAADQIVPHAHFTELIQHNWRPPEFNSLEEMRAELAPRTVLYHKDKTGRLIELLRAERNKTLPVPVLAETESSTRPTDRNRSSQGEARESTSSKGRPEHVEGPDSRGGQLIPWENKLDSLEEIKRLCAALAAFCDSPVTTGKVRDELAFARVIVRAGKRKRRRRK